MDLNNQDESQNVEDVRGSGGFRPIHGIGLGTIAFAVIAGMALVISAGADKTDADPCTEGGT